MLVANQLSKVDVLAVYDVKGNKWGVENAGEHHACEQQTFATLINLAFKL